MGLIKFLLQGGYSHSMGSERICLFPWMFLLSDTLGTGWGCRQDSELNGAVV